MKSWLEWSEWTYQEFERYKPYSVLPVFSDGSGSREEMLSQIEERTRKPVDMAVSDYGVTGEWPKLDAECRTMLYNRIVYAMEICALLSLELKNAPPVIQPPDPSCEDKHVLHWLLIWIWRVFGHKRFLAMESLRLAVMHE